MLVDNVDPRWKSRNSKVGSSNKSDGTPLPVNVTKQLDNLLNTVTGAAEMILQSAGDDMMLRLHAARILRASREGAALITDDKKLS